MNKIFHCGYCQGYNLKEIEQWKGEDVYPENVYDETDNRGIVVECLDCKNITGFVVFAVGVVTEK